MLQTLSYRLPPNGNGYDFITLSAWDNGNSGIGISNETIPFVLLVNIVPQNDPPIISINETDLGLFFDDASVWEVGSWSGLYARKCSLKVGLLFSNQRSRLQFIEHYKRLSRTRRSPENKRTIQSQRTIFSGFLPYIVN
jgi:hypothetical protein